MHHSYQQALLLKLAQLCHRWKGCCRNSTNTGCTSLRVGTNPKKGTRAGHIRHPGPHLFIWRRSAWKSWAGVVAQTTNMLACLSA